MSHPPESVRDFGITELAIGPKTKIRFRDAKVQQKNYFTKN